MTQPGVELVTQRTPRVVVARKLLQRKHRDVQREFLVEGPQGIRAALSCDTHQPVQQVFATLDSLARHADILELARSRRVEVVGATPEAIASLTQSRTPQGLVAVCTFIDVALESLALEQADIVVVAVQIQDPGNAGTILRVADAAGVQAVIFTDDSVDPYNDKCVRASAGSVFHPAVVRGGSAATVLEVLSAAGLQTLATSSHAITDLFAFADSGGLATRSAWIFGNEAQGLPAEIARFAHHQLAIPIFGQAESLNLATAAAVCLYASAREMHRR